MEESRPTPWVKFKQIILGNLLTYSLLCSIILGCALGLIIRTNTEPLSERQATYLGLPGGLLIRMMKCSATPLIIACVIVALGSLELAVSKRICWHLLVLVFCTKLLSACVGLTMVLLIHPGRPGHTTSDMGEWQERHVVVEDIFLDMIRNIIASNMIRMYLQHYETVPIPPDGNQTENDQRKWEVGNEFPDGMNILGMIIVAVVVGLSLAILQEQGKGLYTIAKNVYDVSMEVVVWVLWSSPFLIFFLILSEILKIDNFGDYVSTWGVFLLTTHAGFLFIFVVQYPLLIFLLTGENPFKLIAAVAHALITAYATASSIATMPLVIDGLIKHGIDKRLVRFVVPIGININKDGATNFLVVATIFVAQMLDITLTWGDYFAIIILCAMGSVATASVPFSIIVVLVMVLSGLGMKQNLVGGILAVEWINDRAATTCNIFGNCCQPKILAKWNKKAFGETEDTTVIT